MLEIGTGSGYQTALLALLTETVFSVERIPVLAQSARAALEAAGIRNVTVLVGDGTLGWRPFAPYDAILVAAASPEIPEPLVEQLLLPAAWSSPSATATRRRSRWSSGIRPRPACHHPWRRAVRSAPRRHGFND